MAPDPVVPLPPVAGTVVDGWSTDKAKIAAVVQTLTQVLSALSLLALPDSVKAYITVALQVAGAIATVLAVLSTPNKPIVAGVKVDGSYTITTAG